MNKKQKNRVLMETTDRLNRIVKLYDHTWEHIMSKHSDDFSTYDEIKEVLEDPLIITQSEQKENRTLYYKYNTSTSNFSTVVVEDNSIECFVVTAYKTNNSKVKLFPPIYYAKVEPYIKKEGETNENTWLFI